MAGKNNHRYQIRKRMNSIKHVPEPLFPEPPTVIHNWEELSKATSETHYLDIDKDMSSGWVRPKFEIDDKDPSWWMHNAYLSTHTFYGHDYFQMTVLLRNLGFNIQLTNWDGETVPCRR